MSRPCSPCFVLTMPPFCPPENWLSDFPWVQTVGPCRFNLRFRIPVRLLLPPSLLLSSPQLFFLPFEGLSPSANQGLHAQVCISVLSIALHCLLISVPVLYSSTYRGLKYVWIQSTLCFCFMCVQGLWKPGWPSIFHVTSVDLVLLVPPVHFPMLVLGVPDYVSIFASYNPFNFRSHIISIYKKAFGIWIWLHWTFRLYSVVRSHSRTFSIKQISLHISLFFYFLKIYFHAVCTCMWLLRTLTNPFTYLHVPQLWELRGIAQVRPCPGPFTFVSTRGRLSTHRLVLWTQLQPLWLSGSHVKDSSGPLCPPVQLWWLQRWRWRGSARWCWLLVRDEEWADPLWMRRNGEQLLEVHTERGTNAECWGSRRANFPPVLAECPQIYIVHR